MKIYKLQDVTGEFDVEYLVDQIADEATFTVYQIKQYVNGVMQIGLNDAAIRLGFPDAIAPIDFKTIFDFAETNNMTIKVFQNTVNGETESDLLYYGGAIGEEEL